AETITFRVTHDGKVEVKDNGNWVARDNATVKMEDALKALPIEPAKTSVKVQKAWSGKDAATMPEITVYLVKNGQRTTQSIKLNQANNWTGTFKDLPVVDKVTDAKANVYTVEEDGVKDGKVTVDGNVFAVTMTGTAKDGYTITNTYQPTEKEVTFSKVEVNQTQELPGANLKVVEGEGKDGKLVEEWTSGTTAHKVTLKEGTYTMIETQAPTGYAVAETITFRVTHDGKVEVKDGNGNWVERKDALVRMEDALSEQPGKPNKPGQPDEPGTPNGGNNHGNGNNQGKYPQTGENTSQTLLMLGLVVVAGAAGALVMKNKKQK
ncbi:MAG: Cna B-type domain-containing protein, partial [Aerococcus sp.]|nr:Cna B-type domain-containing protein [Aerococcus sp.]